MTDPRPHSAAGAARRATGDPDTFVIPADALPPGFAEKVTDDALIPAPPRPAATVVLVRDAEGGLLNVSRGFTGGWRLLSLSGGRPVGVFGEWDGETLSPLAAWRDGRYAAL